MKFDAPAPLLMKPRGTTAVCRISCLRPSKDNGIDLNATIEAIKDLKLPPKSMLPPVQCNVSNSCSYVTKPLLNIIESVRISVRPVTVP